MQGNKRVPTPEQLADCASRALFVEDIAMDAGADVAGVAYLLCRKSKLEIGHTIVAVDSAQLVSLAITCLQVSFALNRAATQAGILKGKAALPELAT